MPAEGMERGGITGCTPMSTPEEATRGVALPARPPRRTCEGFSCMTATAVASVARSLVRMMGIPPRVACVTV